MLTVFDILKYSHPFWGDLSCYNTSRTKYVNLDCCCQTMFALFSSWTVKSSVPLEWSFLPFVLCPYCDVCFPPVPYPRWGFMLSSKFLKKHKYCGTEMIQICAGASVTVGAKHESFYKYLTARVAQIWVIGRGSTARCRVQVPCWVMMCLGLREANLLKGAYTCMD